MKVLIIDDDEIDRMAILRILKKSGFKIDNIDQAQNAILGIEKASSFKYDLILLDYRMPPTNGFEVLRRLKDANIFDTAIVMLSHSSEDSLALKCIEAGAQDFLMKSELTVSRLKRAILMAKERHQMELQIRNNSEQLRKLAEQDSLTGLANRYFFDEALKRELSGAKRDRTEITLILFDLDKFKNINDTQGHLVGDLLLMEVAQRIKNVVRTEDLVCRLGGDEFAVLSQNMTHPGQIRMLTHRMTEALKEPLTLQGREILISLSLGVATFPDCATTAVELMKCADVAMYRSKNLGRNQVQFYSKVVHERMMKKSYLEQELTHALERDELFLMYQPQVDAVHFNMIGAEVLIRWQHPELGLLGPDEFIPIAEETGLIQSIGRWVLQTACQQFALWDTQSLLDDLSFTVSANVSARQLRDHGLVGYLEGFMQKCHIKPSRFELELTESCLDADSDALGILQKLSDLGVSLALDDFGTGYSSLSHLQNFPFNVIKIDKSFVQNIGTVKQSDFLKALSGFASSLKYNIVAEGVETELQKSFCASLGIDRLQGFLFSEPVLVSDFEKLWLKKIAS